MMMGEIGFGLESLFVVVLYGLPQYLVVERMGEVYSVLLQVVEDILGY